MPLYAIVYHTFENSDEVELVVNRFFKSEHKAWKWFNERYFDLDRNDVEVVQVNNFGTLTFEKPSLP